MNKSADAFRTISEVADALKLPQHVLRFWETRFNQIKPIKRGGGRRYYRPEDVDLLRGIRALLYGEGYTIRGAQRLLKEHGNKYAIQIGRGEIPEIDTGEIAEDRDAETPKTAVKVSEFEKNAESRSRSIFGRIAGGGKENSAASNNPDLPEEDRRNLQATLYELLECKRLLDQTRQN